LNAFAPVLKIAASKHNDPKIGKKAIQLLNLAFSVSNTRLDPQNITTDSKSMGIHKPSFGTTSAKQLATCIDSVIEVSTKKLPEIESEEEFSIITVNSSANVSPVGSISIDDISSPQHDIRSRKSPTFRSPETHMDHEHGHTKNKEDAGILLFSSNEEDAIIYQKAKQLGSIWHQQAKNFDKPVITISPNLSLQLYLPNDENEAPQQECKSIHSIFEILDNEEYFSYFERYLQENNLDTTGLEFYSEVKDFLKETGANDRALAARSIIDRFVKRSSPDCIGKYSF